MWSGLVWSVNLQIVFEILVRGLIGLEAGPEMQQLKQQFQEFIVGLMSLPIKLPGTRLYRSLQVPPLSPLSSANLAAQKLSSASLAATASACHAIAKILL